MSLSIPEGVRHIDIQMQRTGLNPINDLKYLYSLRSIYKKERPDYIFHMTIKPNIYGTIAANSLGIKSTAMIAGLGTAFSGNICLKSLIKILYRYALSNAHKVFVLNEDNAKRLVDQKIVRIEQVVHLKGGEGVNLRKFEYIENHTAPVTFLMVARMLYDKGYREAVEAVKIVQQKYPGTKLELLGPIDDTSLNAVSRQQIENDENKGWITYLGCTNNPSAIMSRPGILLLLLSSYHEGLNRSLMEGCALGKPIITSDIPGCRETVIDGKNGFLVPPKNAEALASAMLRYLSLNQQQRKIMSENSRLLAEQRFDIEYVIKEYDKIIGTTSVSK